MTMAPVLKLDKLALSLEEERLFTLSMTIRGGEVASVMGPSGSGKSSLLASIAGFLDPVFTLTGRIELNGEELSAKPAEQRQIGLLFQDALLYPHLSVGGNLLFGLPHRRSLTAAQRREKVDRALDSVGLAGFFDRDPATLSGGQQSRIALMRLLLSEPKAVLLDEPFANLDAQLKTQTRDLVFDTLRMANVPALLVTHDRLDADAAQGQLVEL